MSLENLRRKLASKKTRVDLRYKYYDMKNDIEHYGGMLPNDLKWMTGALGWCAKAVDSLADRLVYDGIEHDEFMFKDIFRLNNADVLFDSAILSALISSCSFVYITRGKDGFPELQVIDGANATGKIDPITNLLEEGYVVLDRDDSGNVIKEAYLTAYRTEYYINGKLDESLTMTHQAPYALLVPIIYRQDAKRPFGHSRISRACINIMQSALRTLRRAEVSGEYYSLPQRYVLGLSEEAEFDKKKATMSTFLRFGKDEDGDKPTLGQFEQHSMAPFTEQFKLLASTFAGETGLTLEDMGFPLSNPSSSEAIRAAHETLRLTARKAQRSFASGLLNVGYLSACVRDDKEYNRKAFSKVKISWQPIFEPDAAALSGIGDAILKINQAVPGFLGGNNIKQLTGIEAETDLSVVAPATVPSATSKALDEDKTSKGLNGAQTQSLMAVIAQYSAGTLSEGQAVNLISTAIGVPKTVARNILKGEET